MTWVVLTVAAAFLQNLRSILQKRLTGPLSINGAAYVRFCFALPFAWLYLAVLLAISGLPEIFGPQLMAVGGFALGGAVAQILGTACLVAAFTRASFAVSTALSKTEAMQTALVGFLVLGDVLAPGPLAGIGVSFVGVLLLMSGVSLRSVLGDARGLALGVLAGTGVAVAAVCFRGAALALADGDTALRAGLTLALALTLQTLLMGGYLALREPAQLRLVAATWRRGIWVGVFGAAASVGWFTAMTLEASALVRALGQVELLFALAASWWLFRERVRPRELAGVAALLLGILLLI